MTDRFHRAGEPEIARQRRDDGSRLRTLYTYLTEHPAGARPEAIASHLNVSLRQAYRDLKAVQFQTGVRLARGKNGDYSIERQSELPPVQLSVIEGVAMFSLIAVYLRSGGRDDVLLREAYDKLSTVLPSAMTESDNVGPARSRGPEEALVALHTLIDAISTLRTVDLVVSHDGRDVECVLEPYAIERSSVDRRGYLVGFDCQARLVRMFDIMQVRRAAFRGTMFTRPVDVSQRTPRVGASGYSVLEFKLFPPVANQVHDWWMHPAQEKSYGTEGALHYRLEMAAPEAAIPWLLSLGASV